GRQGGQREDGLVVLCALHRQGGQAAHRPEIEDGGMSLRTDANRSAPARPSRFASPLAPVPRRCSPCLPPAPCPPSIVALKPRRRRTAVAGVLTEPAGEPIV